MCHDLWGSQGCDMLACPALHSLLKLEETQGMATHRWYQSMHPGLTCVKRACGCVCMSVLIIFVCLFLPVCVSGLCLFLPACASGPCVLLSVCLPVCLSVCPSICLSVCVCLPVQAASSITSHCSLCQSGVCLDPDVCLSVLTYQLLGTS